MVKELGLQVRKRTPKSFFICQKFRQNLKKFGQRNFDICYNNNVIILLCY